MEEVKKITNLYGKILKKRYMSQKDIKLLKKLTKRIYNTNPVIL
jgi:hypothetical protein